MTLRPWLHAGLTFTLCLSLYGLTRTAVHTYDALSYILDVDRKPWQELFHPHHLAYGAMGALIKGGARALGWVGSAEWLFQGANMLAGAVGVALFGTLASRTVTPRRDDDLPVALAGAAAALLLAVSYAYWYYAVEVEVYTIAACCLIACLWLLLAVARKPTPSRAAALGVAQSCAVLFHQTNILLCVPVFVALIYGVTAEPQPLTVALRRLWRPALAYGVPFALLVGGAYLGVGFGVSGLRSWVALANWMAGYATTGFWGGAVDGAKFVRLGQGLAGSLAQTGGTLVGLALFALLLVGLRGLRAAPRGVVAICLGWLLVYGAFFVWWEPDNIEFWIASMPPCYLLVVLAVFQPHAPKRNVWLAALVLGACSLTLLGLNYSAITRRGDAALDLQRVTARALAAQSKPGDLLVVPDGLPELYLPFYEGRANVASLSQAMAVTRGDWTAACAVLQARIDGALAGGYAVLIGAEARRPVPNPPGEPPSPAERFGLSPEQVAGCYAPYDPALEPLPLGLISPPAYLRLPDTQTLADGPGWDFTRSHWGWQATNAATTASAYAGWALRPGRDPALTSPPVQLDTARYTALEVRMAAGTTARDAQLFFLDEQGHLDEARSVRWSLGAGTLPQTYRLDLGAVPGWRGVVTGLRLDPVGAGDGGAVVIESIRLVRR